MLRVGQRLYQARISKKLSLEDVSRATKIKAPFLAAIEKGEYGKLPSPMYAQGFVRNYAVFLGLPRTEITALFRREFDEKKAYKVLPDSLTKTKEFPLRRIRIQESLLVLSLVLLLFLGYAVFQYRAAFFPPMLSLSSPQQTITTSQDITITGTTDSNAIVTINKEAVTVNSKGEFTKQLTLFPGKTDIVVTAKNRFGKETTVQRTIVVK